MKRNSTVLFIVMVVFVIIPNSVAGQMKGFVFVPVTETVPIPTGSMRVYNPAIDDTVEMFSYDGFEKITSLRPMEVKYPYGLKASDLAKITNAHTMQMLVAGMITGQITEGGAAEFAKQVPGDGKRITTRSSETRRIISPTERRARRDEIKEKYFAGWDNSNSQAAQEKFAQQKRDKTGIYAPE